ncbi:hypothetical protein FQN55_003836 [Onygenales sp. PD_40]|nr:hypothetical protein FQN55_003836 [Onygenales sp. PD_40]KAK2787097.1 hypothetical protein FQN52_007363 [Onygenales sp. PD_12]KAK2787590.1 hypothetical protein FQN53_005040 [Emmonsiellopsis sp. PD_33]KAK2795136.1 hypothetical protein FQN51_000555 [Onygenales sp. PD_10]
MLFKISGVLLLSGMASAHCTMQYAQIDGQETEGIIRLPPNNNPIQDVSDVNMACNINGNTPSASTAEIAAGGSLTLEWHHEGRDSEAIADSHKGPVITYLAAVDSAGSATTPENLGWFKIAETGLDGQTWAVDTLIANNGKWDVSIPSSIAPGEYLVRQEIIALHSAGSPGGAQFYIGCAQIKVTGGGSASPETVKFPGAYPADHPGIVVNIYDGSGGPYPASYEIPGPAVFSG